MVNPVGSGDSTVVGIASAIVHNLSDKDFLRHANALGMLNAQENDRSCQYDKLRKLI